MSRKPITFIIPYNSFLRDLIVLYDQTVLVAKHNAEEYLKEIERELKESKKLKKKFPKRYQHIREEYKIKFIQHSLSLEGNPITLPDTIKILRNHIVPKDLDLESVQEIQNYQKAVDLMMKESDDKKPLTKDSMLNYHYLAMQHRSKMAGKVRKVEVYIHGNRDFKVAKAKEIETKLATLLEKYNILISKKRHPLKDILKFAAYLHNEFQYIHPFEDGNSRTTRLLAFHFLRSQNIPIFDIPLGLLESYLFATKGSKKRNDKELMQILELIILYNLKTINERLKE